MLKFLMASLLVLLPVSTFAQIDTARPVCDTKVVDKSINAAVVETNSAAVFTNPRCIVEGKAIPIALGYSGNPLREVNADIYCKLKGYVRSIHAEIHGDFTQMVSFDREGGILDVTEMNSLYFTTVYCAEKMSR